MTVPIRRSCRDPRRRPRLRVARRIACALALLLASCGRDRDAPAPLDQGATAPSADAAIVVDDAPLALRLEAAAEEARRTAPAARQRFRDADVEERARWSVRWAAPLLDGSGRFEHVWVRPLDWSPTRIEGILLTQPRLRIGAVAGDEVAFGAESLTDWLYEAEDGSVDGGFAARLLGSIGRSRVAD